jgi:cell division transport system permease protein
MNSAVLHVSNIVLAAIRRLRVRDVFADGEGGDRRAIVPADSIASKSLVTVISIMTFLAALMTGFGLMVRDASVAWSGSISNEMTIQVRPSPNRDTEADIRKAVSIAEQTSGVARARVIAKEDSQRMLEPWLGTDLDLSDLPIPRLIVVELDGAKVLDRQGFRRRLQQEAPFAILDDHGLWIERLTTMARTTVAATIGILALVVAAMALAVSFATRGAMAGNQGIIDVLHMVGATDGFIAREFQKHFLRLGLRGGVIGGAAAILAFLGIGAASRLWGGSAGEEQIEALFGTFQLTTKSYVMIALVSGGIGSLSGAVSKRIVFRHLRGFE